MPNQENKRIKSRKQLIDTINRKLPRNGQNGAGYRFTDFNAYIENLQNEHKALDLRETDKLIKEYTKCGSALVKYLEKVRDEKKAEPYRKLSKKLSKDYAALVRYRKKIQAHEQALEEGKQSEFRPWDIDQFFEQTTTRTVSLNGKSLDELKRYGAGSNVRYSVMFPRKDEPVKGVGEGELFNAFFTEDEAIPEGYKNKEDNYLEQKTGELADETVKKYPALKNILKKGSASQKIVVDYRCFVEGDTTASDIRLHPGKVMTFNTEDQLLSKLKGYIKKGVTEENGYTHQDQLNYLKPLETIEKMNRLTDAEKRLPAEDQAKLLEKKAAEKTEALTGLVEYIGLVGRVHFQNEVKDEHKMNKTKPSGQRNALMSDLAQFFGCGEVVAFSEKMKLKVMENGKEVTKKGIIMMPAEGEDHGHAGPASHTGKATPMNLIYTDEEEKEGKNNGRLIKEVACLQLLDLICGNTDRHTANYFCKYDPDGHMVGVQGIDNDTAFGAEEDIGKLGYSIAFKNFRIIPKSMADVIQNTSSDAFLFMLQGYGLNKEEMNTVKNRFNTIKEELKKSEEKYKDAVPGYLDPDCPRIVPDDELKDYAINEQLCYSPRVGRDRLHDNLFARIMPADSNISVMQDQLEYRMEDIMDSAMAFKKAFIEKGKNSFHAGLRDMQAMDSKALTREEKNSADTHFREVRDCMKDLLSDSDFRKDYVYGLNERVGSMYGNKIRMIGFTGLVTDVSLDQLKEQRFEELPDDQLQRELPVYRKLENALNTVNEYLYDDAVVKTADRYQEFQYDLQNAEGDARKKLMKELKTFTNTAEFKKYKTVLNMKNKLITEMERFEDMQRECHQVNQAKEFLIDMLGRENKYTGNYRSSEKHMNIINRINETNIKQMELENKKNAMKDQKPGLQK